ncbi:hypothetical protein JCM11491_003255 [Sporobolomyces phaffii]
MDLTPDAIVHALTTLPLDTNPYYWLAELLRANYLPHYSKSAIVQIYVGIGIFAFNALLILLSLFLRIHKKQFWFFRRQLSGTLIQPNLACVGGCLGLVILGLTIFLFLTIVKCSAVNFPTYLGYLSLSLGFTPNLVGTIAIWSLSSGFLVHLHCQDPNRPLGRWKVASNVFGIVAPFVVLAIFLPLDIIAGRRYVNTVTIFFGIDSALLAHGDRWTPSPSRDLAGLLDVVPLFNALVAEYALLRPIWQANYLFNSITTVLLVIVLSSIAAVYFSSVRRLIGRAKLALLEESCRGADLLAEVRRTWIVSLPSFSRALDLDPGFKEGSLKLGEKTMKSLVLAMLLFVLIAAITFGLSLFSAIRPLILSQAYILASFWSNTLLSVTMSAVLLWHSWTLESDRDRPPAPTTFGTDAVGSAEEKLGHVHRLAASQPHVARRRRSSIWFDDVFQQKRDDSTPEPTTTTAVVEVEGDGEGEVARGVQRGREESDSTCVGVDFFRRLEPVLEGGAFPVIVDAEPLKDVPGGGRGKEDDAIVRAGLSSYRIVE